jgi:hypothetical protein
MTEERVTFNYIVIETENRPSGAWRINSWPNLV